MAFQFTGLIFRCQGHWNCGKLLLRGYQMTDDNGTVQFTTIYPGWYEGRAIQYTSRLEPSRDQMKPWNGHHSLP
ncbi:MAG TPA: hypothetical protein VE573_13460 [Nitrososphaeraceae archaeon]|nr:hypothetical protein [Nitrososphaeraceae archaeon]